MIPYLLVSYVLSGMSLVGDDHDEESLGSVLSLARKNTKLIEDHDNRNSHEYKVSKFCFIEESR